MKKYTVLFLFTWIFFTMKAAEPVTFEEMPPFFYIPIWSELLEIYKNNEHVVLKREDSPLVVTTFIPLFQHKKQLQSYVKRLHEHEFFPYVILKVKTDQLCDLNIASKTFSKDRFGSYRFNDIVIPKKAIIESKIHS